MTEESEEGSHPFPEILEGPMLDLEGPNAKVVKLADRPPMIEVTMETAPGEWATRRFPLELWSDTGIHPDYDPEEDRMISFAGSVSREVIETDGRDGIMRALATVQMPEILQKMVHLAEELGWIEPEGPGSVTDEELEEFREEAEEA